MLDQRDYDTVSQDYDVFHQQFTEEDLEKAEYYDIKYDPVQELTSITLFDEKEMPIRTINVEDYDAALAIMEEEFDVDDINEYDYPTDA